MYETLLLLDQLDKSFFGFAVAGSNIHDYTVIAYCNGPSQER